MCGTVILSLVAMGIVSVLRLGWLKISLGFTAVSQFPALAIKTLAFSKSGWTVTGAGQLRASYGHLQSLCLGPDWFNS